MTYAYPPAAEQGQRFKTLLSTYAAAGGKDAVLLLHSQSVVRRWSMSWAAQRS